MISELNWGVGIFAVHRTWKSAWNNPWSVKVFCKTLLNVRSTWHFSVLVTRYLTMQKFEMHMLRENNAYRNSLFGHFFFYMSFLSRIFTITELEGERISLTPHSHFHPLYRHLDIRRAMTVGSSLQYIATSKTWTRNPSFQVANY